MVPAADPSRSWVEPKQRMERLFSLKAQITTSGGVVYGDNEVNVKMEPKVSIVAQNKQEVPPKSKCKCRALVRT